MHAIVNSLGKLILGELANISGIQAYSIIFIDNNVALIFGSPSFTFGIFHSLFIAGSIAIIVNIYHFILFILHIKCVVNSIGGWVG